MTEHPFPSQRMVRRQPAPAEDMSAPPLWRDGNRLVVPRFGCELPDICVKTNRPGAVFQKMQFGYVPQPVVGVGFLLAALGVRIATGALAELIDLMVPLSPELLAERRKHATIGWSIIGVGTLLCFGGPLLGIAMATPNVGNLVVFTLFFGLAVVVAGGIYMRIVTPPLLKVTYMDDHFAWFEGVSPEYLAALPDFRPQR